MSVYFIYLYVSVVFVCFAAPLLALFLYVTLAMSTCLFLLSISLASFILSLCLYFCVRLPDSLFPSVCLSKLAYVCFPPPLLSIYFHSSLSFPPSQIYLPAYHAVYLSRLSTCHFSTRHLTRGKRQEGNLDVTGGKGKQRGWFNDCK